MAKKNGGGQENPPDVFNQNEMADPFAAQSEAEITGFPPYWTPREGSTFFGTVLNEDNRDPAFIRYIVKASADTMCALGPAEDAEPVMVKKGDFFTVSFYSGLALKDFLGYEVWVKAHSKVKTSTIGQSVWRWRWNADRDSKAAIKARVEARLLATADMPSELVATA